MGDYSGEDAIREMAALGRLVRSTRAFLEGVAGSYMFLAYGIAVPASILLAEGLAVTYGLPFGVSVTISSLVGSILSTILVWLIVREVFAPLKSGGRPGAGRRRRPSTLFMATLAVFIGVYMGASYLVYYLAPGFSNVAWYYALDVTLAVLAPFFGGWAFIVASSSMACLLPLVLASNNVDVALASLMFGYLAGGTWSIWRASRILARE